MDTLTDNLWGGRYIDQQWR